MYSKFIKPICDFTFALLLLWGLGPFFLGLLLFHRLLNGPGVFFVQERIGYLEKPFWIYKLRTMRPLMEGEIIGVNEDARISTWNRFLRRTGLDEFPQLINILKGEMSFVGPRPLLPEYLTKYSHEQRDRHLVHPGITGWAQVKGGNNLDWSTRLSLDVDYSKNVSFLLDVKIILLTFGSIFKRYGDSGTLLK